MSIRTYHMTDANEFYNKEDVWAWPEEIFESTPQLIEPYYVLMQLPGSDDLDFVQILPFTPVSRENMIAWLAAQNDPAEVWREDRLRVRQGLALLRPASRSRRASTRIRPSARS